MNRWDSVRRDARTCLPTARIRHAPSREHARLGVWTKGSQPSLTS